MSQSMKITWLTDDTVRVEVVITDFDGSLLTPTSHNIIFYNPSGSAVGTATSPTLDGSGTYHYDYVLGTTAPKGIWKISWKILSGTYPARETINFTTATTFVFNHGLYSTATYVWCSFNFTGWTSWKWTSTTTQVTVTITGTLPASMKCYAKVEYAP